MLTLKNNKENTLEKSHNHSFDRLLSNSISLQANHHPLSMTIKNFNIPLRKPFQWNIKRFIDITASAAGIILISPLLLAIVIAIKKNSKGPALYKQKRIGQYGKIYTMYKFRSMSADAENNIENLQKLNETNEVMFKMQDDPRITKVGKFIRKYSLDELPQLLNVIKGEMSLVGPRPSPIRDYRNYKTHHHFRLATLPGLTGIWQVNGRSEIKSFDQVLDMDFNYIQNWNLALDFSILLKTIPVVLFAKGSA